MFAVQERLDATQPEPVSGKGGVLDATAGHHQPFSRAPVGCGTNSGFYQLLLAWRLIAAITEHADAQVGGVSPPT